MHRFILLKLLLLIFFHFSIGLEFLWIFLCTYYNKLIDILNSRRNILHHNKFDRRYLRLDSNLIRYYNYVICFPTSFVCLGPGI